MLALGSRLIVACWGVWAQQREGGGGAEGGQDFRRLFFLHNKSAYLVDPPQCQPRSVQGKLKALNLWEDLCPQQDSISS